MGTELSNAVVDHEPSKPGLVFDADTITLSGKFLDELSAYRARKRWKELFASYFLLENDRDFEMSVKPSQSGAHHLLVCSFCSACGRYAFWRMINKQAPDAEARLYAPNMINETSARFLLGSIWNNTGGNTPYVYSGAGQSWKRPRKNSFFQNVFSRIHKTFG